MTTNNGSRTKTVLAIVAGLILTVISTVFADRLVIERSEAMATEQRITLRRDLDETKVTLKAEYARRDVVDARFENIEKALNKLDEGQQEIIRRLDRNSRLARER